MEFIANIPGKGPARIEITSGRIASVRLEATAGSDLPFISAGFIDIQINGFGGVNFSDPDLTADDAIRILPAIWETGVTTFCPTLITNSAEMLERNFRVLERARQIDARFAASTPCYHLEGPYLSPGGARGVHDPNLMRPPDWAEFEKLQHAAGGNIAIVTLAPELPGACEFIRQARAAGVVVAIGHTDATPEQIHAAIDAGAQLSTHLGNGCATLMHRHQNPLWAQIAADCLQASLICDGFHLPPDFVRTVYKAKGISRCVLVTDAVHVANQPPGKYSLVGREIELLPTGQVVTADRQSLAGSALSMNRAVAVFQRFAGIPLNESIEAATLNPARLLGRADVCTDLRAGQLANVITFRVDSEALRIERVLLKGEQVYPSA